MFSMKFKIGDKVIGNEEPVFVIAEVANSHEGSLERAKKLVRAAADAGADAVKFQKFVVEEFLVSTHPDFNLFKRLELKDEEWVEIFNFARELNIIVFADVFDIPSASFMASLNVPAYKIHSTDLTNPELLNYVGGLGKPIFLGVGATYLEEIEKAMAFLHKEIVLVHGFQAFPTRIEETNLMFLKTLRKRFQCLVGFMDHVDGSEEFANILPLAALGFGACVIEKHITLDRSEKGIDHESALNPNEFRKFVSRVRKTELAIGSGENAFSENEENYRLKTKKSIVAKRDIKAGEVLAREALAFRRARRGISPMEVDTVIGKVVPKTMKRDDIFF